MKKYSKQQKKDFVKRMKAGKKQKEKENKQFSKRMKKMRKK